MKMKMKLWKDERAADTIPLKLVVYVAIIGVIIIMASVGLKNAAPSMDAALLERQMSEVKSSIELMQSGYARDLSDPYAPTGNIRNFDLVLPDSLEYVCFGVDPDPDNNGNITDTQPGLITDDGNVIYYKLEGSGKMLVSLDNSIHLREGILTGNNWMPNTVDGLQQGVVLTGGTQSLTFELVHDKGITYTLSHVTDDVNVYINPDNEGGLPNGLLVSSSPDSIPADGVTTARVTVQVIDNKGKCVRAENQIINLSSTKGDLSASQIITHSHGSSSVFISSDELGLGIITAHSPGLHEGTDEIVYTLPPVFLEFNDWIMSSFGGGESSELIADFQLTHSAVYKVTLLGWSTEAHWPFMPEEWAIGRIEVDGMILGDNEVASGSKIEVVYGNMFLCSGKHTLRVTMTNDFNVPFIGDRNLYVEKIEFS